MIRKTILLLAVCGPVLFTGCSDKTSSDSSTNSSSSTSPQTTTPPIQIVEKDKILGAICTVAPTKYLDASLELYKCDGGNKPNRYPITLLIGQPTEYAGYEKRFFIQMPESEMLCGNGWKVVIKKGRSEPGNTGDWYQQVDGLWYQPGNTDILYQKLSQAGIPSESCR